MGPLDSENTLAIIVCERNSPSKKDIKNSPQSARNEADRRGHWKKKREAKDILGD